MIQNLSMHVARKFFFGTALCAVTSATLAQDLSRLQGLLNATPAGGWVRVDTGNFNAVWPTGSTAVSSNPALVTANGPGALIYAWGGFTWDSNRAEMLLWGGGHANYAGNEMYAWDAATGGWERKSLPSRVTGGGAIPNSLIVDNAAPQAAHPFDGNVFLPVNDMFINFLGPSYNTGDRGRTNINGVLSYSGPWMFDPTKADANKVGGTTGSGYDLTTLGGNMWINRYGQWTGTEGPYAPYVGTAYRNEGGKDVVYLTMDQGASHFPLVVRYTVGDVRNGGLDKWETIGVTQNTVIRGGTTTLDNNHNLLVRTALVDSLGDLAVWNLANANAAQPTLNKDIAVHLVFPNGSGFVTNDNMAIEYDSANDQFVIWDGSSQGMVWVTKPTFTQSGAVASQWTVVQLQSATVSQPAGNFQTGVFGKWQYIPQLNAFMALDEYNKTTQQAGVWLYKPMATAVPEAPIWALMTLGAVALFLARRRGFPQ